MIVSCGIAVITVGLLLDSISLMLGLRRLRDNGPSGVPILGLLLYFAGIAILTLTKVLSIVGAVMALALLIVLHASCQYIILVICDRLPQPKSANRQKDERQKE